MALAGDIKLKSLYHLCYPATSLTVGNVNFNSIVRDRLEIADSDISDMIEGLVKELDEAEEAITKAKNCLKVEKVSDITMNKDHVRNCINDYNRLLKKLSCSIDLCRMSRGSSVGVSI